jgi:hypothetical protein
MNQTRRMSGHKSAENNGGDRIKSPFPAGGRNASGKGQFQRSGPSSAPAKVVPGFREESCAPENVSPSSFIK